MTHVHIRLMGKSFTAELFYLYHWEVSESSTVVCWWSDALFNSRAALASKKLKDFFFFLLCFSLLCSLCLFFKPVLWKHACKPMKGDTALLCVCSPCSIVWLHLGDTSFTEVWADISHALQHRMLQMRQTLCLPGRAAWATSGPVTTSICLKVSLICVAQYYD